ncbi:MAG: putative tricarboxylic transport rane protein [Alphaproteobacteria bacterium]|nr:putative tricarboxylic transport rane protein [Alphaproteobacteria bacterium]
MGFEMLDAAGHALVMLLDPYRLLMLSCGVVMGLVLGILPGIGGLSGTALLLPFTFTMDPYSAFALLLGLASTTSTGDPIPAIMFGVPGGAGSAATVLDGLPMARRGEAGRALSAAYMSSMMGGVFGAFLMAVTLPLLRPIMLFLGSPELLAFSALGISMVAVLSGNTPLRGLVAAGLGILIAMIGTDPQTGTLRWTFDFLYLWDGLPLVPVVLGLFALPELCDLAVARSSIASDMRYNATAGMWQGAKDCFTNWWLVLRCSWIGAAFGAVPGIGGAVIDWLAYGHAVRTEKGAAQSFGKGDVRGVIAAESANNAREGGALVPTVAFGVPGSAGMAILLGAFLIHGLVPGPDMLTKHLDITYSMVWSIAIANILGSGLCFLFSGQLAKLATLRYTLIMPCVLSLIYIGAFEASRNWGDLYALLFFGMLGWAMKHFKWPRPPLVLGFILGGILERYMFISIERYGISWMLHPVVIVMFTMAALSLMGPLLQDIRAHHGVKAMLTDFGRPRITMDNAFPAALLSLFAVMLYQSLSWSFEARIIPSIVGTGAVLFGGLSLANDMFRRAPGEGGLADKAKAVISEKIHMDIASKTAHLPGGVILLRGFIFFGWMVGFLGSMALIGLIPTVPVFIIAYMRLEGGEKYRHALIMAAVMLTLIYIVFDQLLAIPWPPTVLGDWFPVLKMIPSV